MVNDIIKQVRKNVFRAKERYTYLLLNIINLSKSADDAFNIKKFSQTLTKNLPGGDQRNTSNW